MAEDTGTEPKELEESVLGVSDEDFDKLPEPSVIENEPVSTDGSTDTDPIADESDSSDTDDTSDGDVSSDLPEDTSTEKLAVSGSEDQVNDPKIQNEKVLQEVDYKSEYEKLTKPFKANGGEIQVRNTEEIITLMQMGANYHKKMAALKPSLKLIKLLERNDIDESKLGYLIDLSKKDPSAIQKLVKDSGIDPLDIDVSSETNYIPKTSSVSDVEMQLETVLENIQETPTYARTLSVVTKDWDGDSRKVVAAQPHIIELINGHIGSGIYDKVMSEVNRARSLGKLNGVSDLEAYKQVGDILNNQGLLNQKEDTTPVVNANDTAQKKNDEAKRNAKRIAAGAPQAKKSIAPKPVTNMLSMPDDEFSKLPANAYTKVS